MHRTPSRTNPGRTSGSALSRGTTGPARAVAAGVALLVALTAGCTSSGEPAGPPGSTGGPGSSAPASSAPPSDSSGQPTTDAPDPTSAPPSGDSDGNDNGNGDDNGDGDGDDGDDGTAALSCRDLAGDMSLEQRIGQLFMAGTSTEGITDAESARLSELKVGSVIPLGNSTAGLDAAAGVTDDIRDGVADQKDVEVMIAIDQEGGEVQRLQGPGFDRIPPATEQAELSNRVLRRRAKGWGEELREAGIDSNLAPVADVVPERFEYSNQPVGVLRRGYGPDVDTVAKKNVAFIRGMHDAGVATSLKHFPGLGKVRGNTDFSTDALDRSTTEDDKDLGGFAAGIDAGTEMVMMSSATYQKIDPDRPASYSTKIISGMLRDDLGFDGVVISDALEGEALSMFPVRQRALRFIRAGGDLAIVGQPDLVEPMVQGVRKAAEDDRELQQLITDASTRVLIMKSRLDLADCRP